MIQNLETRLFFMGLALLTGIILSFCSPAVAGDKVLLVHSYHKGYPWVDSITDGVKKGFEGSGVQLEIFYMDTKRKTGEEWKVKAGQMAKEKLDAFKPDVVITSDDNAQAYFARYYVSKKNPQFVFCGVNAEPSLYGFPACNVTGILERPHFLESLTLLKTIARDIETIALITDDGPTSKAVCAYMKKLQKKSILKVVSWDQPSTFAQWRTLIKEYQDSVDSIAFYTYHTVKETVGGNSIEPKKIMNWTMANNKKPTVGFLDFAIEDGVLCGVVESGEEHGFEAAQISKQILKGKKAGDFPLKTAQKGAVMLNKRTAGKLGIEIKVIEK